MEKDEEDDVGVVIKMHMQWQKNLHNCIGYAHGSLSNIQIKGKILSLEASRTYGVGSESTWNAGGVWKKRDHMILSVLAWLSCGRGTIQTVVPGGWPIWAPQWMDPNAFVGLTCSFVLTHFINYGGEDNVIYKSPMLGWYLKLGFIWILACWFWCLCCTYISTNERSTPSKLLLYLLL